MSGNTCNAGLQCADDVQKCVTVGASGTGGDASGTGGTSSGTGGAVSTGGTSATGGAGGQGGAHATGGAGGASATGGSTGTGGSGQTGGSMGNCFPATGSGTGTNMVMNGDLSDGTTGWNIGQGSPTSSGVMNGAYCATFSNMTVLLGWGNSSVHANLTSGTSYTLSYQASASNGSATTLEIHVGQAVSPYNNDLPDPGKIACDTLSASLTTYSHTFTASASDSNAGIAFLFGSSASGVTGCVTNVTLTQN